MAQTVDFSVEDATEAFTIAEAANLWAGFSGFYAPADKPLVLGEPAQDQTAKSVTSMTGAVEFLKSVKLKGNAYRIATAMKAAVKAGRLGKQEEPFMEMKR